MCVEKLHRLPREVPFTYDEAIMLLALAVDQDAQTNVCEDCVKEEDGKEKTCYRCGKKYNSPSSHSSNTSRPRGSGSLSRRS